MKNWVRVETRANKIRDYLKNPQYTIEKILSWFNAKWQLRKCDQVGYLVRLRGHIYIRNQGQILIGRRVHIFSHYARTVFSVFPGGKLEIGDHSVINYGVDIACTKSVRIGSECLIGTHVMILDTDFHKSDKHFEVPESKAVDIRNKVWIGNRSIILPGVTIGEGSTIGAGSLVVNDIPPYSLAVGNPARVIKKL